MTEEEYFRKNYPDSCYGDKPLSPYWDYFQNGVEFGERQSEKKIAELEKENTELKKTYRKQRNKRIDELQKGNAELKEDYFYSRCIRSTCPYIHTTNRNCMAVGGFFTAVSNKQCPMMKNLNANVKLTKAKEIIKSFLSAHTDDLITEAEQFLSEVEE